MAAFTAALFYNLISFHTLFALQLRLVRNELTRTWCCSSKDRLYFYQVWFLNVDGVWRAFSIGIFRYYVCMVDRLMEMVKYVLVTNNSLVNLMEPHQEVKASNGWTVS
ncbi:hypothetical protein QQP08_023533 [Theobroma cacao]|nr:hypothetical protein QQP08_023533 [Theobroma cacao]